MVEGNDKGRGRRLKLTLEAVAQKDLGFLYHGTRCP